MLTHSPTGFAYHPLFLKHDTGPGHPECPKRLIATLDHLQKLSWFSELKTIQPAPAEIKWLHEAQSGAH